MTLFARRALLGAVLSLGVLHGAVPAAVQRAGFSDDQITRAEMIFVVAYYWAASGSVVETGPVSTQALEEVFCPVALESITFPV